MALRELFARDVMNTPVKAFRERETVARILEVLRSWCVLASVHAQRGGGSHAARPPGMPCSTHNGFPVVRDLSDAEAQSASTREPVCMGVILRNQIITLLEKGAYFPANDPRSQCAARS